MTTHKITGDGRMFPRPTNGMSLTDYRRRYREIMRAGMSTQNRQEALLNLDRHYHPRSKITLKTYSEIEKKHRNRDKGWRPEDKERCDCCGQILPPERYVGRSSYP